MGRRSRTPRPATRPRTRTSRSARSSSAACSASPARAACPTATTSTSTPARPPPGNRGPARPAARRRQHADAAPARRPLRDAGAAEPARARRPDRGLPDPRLDAGSDREAAGAGARTRRDMRQRRAGLRGQRPAAGGQGEGRVPAPRAASCGRRAADEAPRSARTSPTSSRSSACSCSASRSARTSSPTSACASRSWRSRSTRSRSSCPTPRPSRRARARPSSPPACAIGDIGKVELEDGKAVVELQLEPKYKGFIREDATALLRAKTGHEGHVPRGRPGRRQAAAGGRPHPGLEHAAGHRPGRVPLRARRRHARLPEAADLRRRQGPRGPRHRPARGAASGSGRCTGTSRA